MHTRMHSALKLVLLRAFFMTLLILSRPSAHPLCELAANSVGIDLGKGKSFVNWNGRPRLQGSGSGQEKGRKQRMYPKPTSPNLDPAIRSWTS